MIQFTYNPKKATQAASYLLGRSGRRMNYTKLIKILYLADREALRRFDQPITTDAPFSMDNGPILSHIYNHIKVKEERGPYWHNLIDRKGYDVALKKRAPIGELSPCELEIIDEIFQQFGHMEVWDLVAYCHKNLPEWTDPEGSSIPISFEKILKAAGRSRKEIEKIQKETKSFESIQSLLSVE